MTKLLLIAVFCTVSLFSFSQDNKEIVEKLKTRPNVEPQEQKLKVNKSNEPAHTLTFIADPSSVEDAWRDFAKKELNHKLNRSKGLYMAENIMLERISTGPISLYSNIEKQKEGSQLQLWIKSGEEYVSHKRFADIAERTDAVLRDFANYFYDEYYEKVVDDQESEQKELEKVYKNLEKSDKKLRGNLESNQDQIENNKEEIVESEKEIKELQNKIEELKKSNENLAEANKTLEKDIEKSKEKMKEQQKVVDRKKEEIKQLESNAKSFEY